MALEEFAYLRSQGGIGILTPVDIIAIMLYNDPAVVCGQWA